MITIRYFGSLKESLGKSIENINFTENLTVLAVWNLTNPNLSLAENILTAVNMDYVSRSKIVKQGDEIAFFSACHRRLNMTVKIVDHVFDPLIEIQNFQNSAHFAGKFGATSIFIGSMRDFNEGDDVQSMTLEHYDGMTQKQLFKIIDDAKAQWQFLDCLIVHRVGEILPNEPIVLVSIWSAHRAEAFDSCRYVMEALKTHAPFWKRETLTTNETRWVTTHSKN